LLTLYMTSEVQLPDRYAGMTVGYMSGMLTLFMALFGGFVDRMGVRKAMTIAISVGLFGRGLLLAAPRMPLPVVVSLIALTFMAFSAGIVMTSAYSGAKEATDARTSAIGFALLYALMNGGSLAEQFTSPLVREAYGLRGVFWMCTAITVVYLFVHLFLYPQNETAKGTVVVSKEKVQWKDHPLRDARFVFFIFILLGVRTLFAHQWLTMPAYVTRAYPPEVGARFEWLVGLNPLIILIFTPLVAALTGRVNVVKMMIVGTLVSALATFLLVPGPNLTSLIVYMIVFSFGEAMWSSRFLEYVGQTAPAGRVGLYMGVANVPWFLAKLTTGLYSGFMLERFCPQVGVQNTSTLWLIYGIFAMSSPIGLILASRWLTKKAA
jgi:MFS family permease